MGINLLDQLNDIRSKNTQPTNAEILAGFEALLSQPTEGERILGNLFTSEGNSEMLNFDALEASRIYHIEDIKKLCVDYRLRFLDSKHFNGTFPAEALDAIKAFEKATGARDHWFQNDCSCWHVQTRRKRQRPLVVRSYGRWLPLPLGSMGK